MGSISPSESGSKKDRLIGQLLDKGVYKCKNRQLYELSVSDLEQIYRRLACSGSAAPAFLAGDGDGQRPRRASAEAAV
ncbi:MAG: Fur-regulated basic protein FbpA [Sporolactobacillus sp.]